MNSDYAGKPDIAIRRWLTILVLALSLLLAGCSSGARESEEILYVVAMGLDKGEAEGTMKISYQIAIPRTGENVKSSDLTEIITVTATSLTEGVGMLNSVITGYPAFLHTKVIIIGEDLAREGLGKILTPFQRYREYRGSMFFLVARGTAEQVIRANEPRFTITPSKYYEQMMLSGVESGHFLRTSIHEVYTRLRSHSGHPYAALVAVSPSQSHGKVHSGVEGENDRKYLAGDLPRKGGNKLEFAGTAVFAGDTLVGMLDNIETRMLAMLLGKFPQGYLSMRDPLQAREVVNVRLHLEKRPHITVSFVDGRPFISVTITLQGELTNISSGINYEKTAYLKLIEAQVSQIYQEDMLNMIKRTQLLDADVAGFGYYARYAFKTRQDLKAYNWKEKYRDAEVKVAFTTRIRRSGLMIRTVPD